MRRRREGLSQILGSALQTLSLFFRRDLAPPVLKGPWMMRLVFTTRRVADMELYELPLRRNIYHTRLRLKLEGARQLVTFYFILWITLRLEHCQLMVGNRRWPNFSPLPSTFYPNDFFHKGVILLYQALWRREKSRAGYETRTESMSFTKKRGKGVFTPTENQKARCLFLLRFSRRLNPSLCV